jgi:hypothetical protein
MNSVPAPADNFDIVIDLLRLKGLQEAARWLTTPRADLGGLTPEDALACGRRAEVARLVLGLATVDRLAS